MLTRLVMNVNTKIKESKRSVMLLPASLSFYHTKFDFYNWKMFHNNQKFWTGGITKPHRGIIPTDVFFYITWVISPDIVYLVSVVYVLLEASVGGPNLIRTIRKTFMDFCKVLTNGSLVWRYVNRWSKHWYQFESDVVWWPEIISC